MYLQIHDNRTAGTTQIYLHCNQTTDGLGVTKVDIYTPASRFIWCVEKVKLVVYVCVSK